MSPTPSRLQIRYFGPSYFSSIPLYIPCDLEAETDIVKEAISRLPPTLQDERSFRITRALQCCVEKTVLPKDQWSTWEDHKAKGFYLKPYIDEVIREMDEKE